MDQSLLFAAVTAAAVIVAVLIAILVTRRGPSAEERSRVEAELAALRAESAGLAQRLAVEEVRSARIGELEAAADAAAVTLDELRESKASLEAQLAARQEAAKAAEAALAELRTRNAVAENTVTSMRNDLEIARREKAEIEVDRAGYADREQTHRTAMAKLAEDLKAALEQVGNFKAETATLREMVEQESRQSQEKLALMLAARDQMRADFKLLADDVMKQHGEAFTKQNKEQIDGTLQPLREKLAEFQQRLHESHLESEKSRAAFGEQLRSLTENSSRMTAETSNLTRALKGRAQMQGAWGEMILETILSKSGLRAGEEYVVQQSHAGDDGERLRTDVIVRLPNNRAMIIDAKVSLTAFEQLVNAPDDAARADAARAHAQSLRSHIRGLGEKGYHKVADGSLDYVLMFVPIEGALAAALETDPTLTAQALEANVCIATPTTLMIVLRTAENIWSVERRNRNADEIALRAGALYDKMSGFVGDMTSLGKGLATAQDLHRKAMDKLTSGRGNLLKRFDDLKRLGAKTSKPLPAGLFEDDEDLPLSLPAGAEAAGE